MRGLAWGRERGSQDLTVQVGKLRPGERLGLVQSHPRKWVGRQTRASGAPLGPLAGQTTDTGLASEMLESTDPALTTTVELCV